MLVHQRVAGSYDMFIDLNNKMKDENSWELWENMEDEDTLW